MRTIFVTFLHGYIEFYLPFAIGILSEDLDSKEKLDRFASAKATKEGGT